MLAQKHPDTFHDSSCGGGEAKGPRLFRLGAERARENDLRAVCGSSEAGCSVATPLTWDEVKSGLDPKSFHIRNAIERFRKVGDLFAGVLDSKQRLEEALDRLQKLM